jgi:hypothetical protein
LLNAACIELSAIGREEPEDVVMTDNAQSAETTNIILLRGAALWILVALVLAWCLVSLKMEAPLMLAIFPGKFSRVLHAHIDFLLMSALLLGF